MIFYEDEFCLIVKKNPGEICGSHNDSQKTDFSLVSRIINERKMSSSRFLGCVHRLDRPVFGLCLLAKSAAAYTEFTRLFADGRVKKSYVAIVEGKFPNSEEKILEASLFYSLHKQKSYILTEKSAQSMKDNSKISKTAFRIFGSCDRYSFVLAKPLTGRTHQIRAQLANEGLIIKGDVKYGAKRSDREFPIRLMAKTLQFRHPFTGEDVFVECDFPEDDSLWRLCGESYAVLRGLR